MRRGEAVYFFTLIDFLLTTVFFGIVLFSVAQSSTAQHTLARASDAKSISDLKRVSGVSDIAQLTDELTRLVPLRNARDAVSIVKQLGGAQNARRLAHLQEQAGGSDSLLAKMQRLVEGAGRPYCLFNISQTGRKYPIPIGRIVATDSGMSFSDSSAALEQVLTELGVSFEDVRFLRFDQFRSVFGPLRAKSCAYTVRVVERTNYKFARAALYGVFYTQFEQP